MANTLPMEAMIEAAQWGLLFLVDVPESNCLLEKKQNKNFVLFKLLPAKIKWILLHIFTFLKWVRRSAQSLVGSLVLTRLDVKVLSPICLQLLLTPLLERVLLFSLVMVLSLVFSIFNIQYSLTRISELDQMMSMCTESILLNSTMTFLVVLVLKRSFESG